MKGQLLFCLVIAVSQHIHGAFSRGPSSPYHALYNFGDSISDTGNCLFYGDSLFQNTGKLPYGMTFFGKPTGRSCDGRLIIDFLAEEFGLPYLVPGLVLKRQISEKYYTRVKFSGANFAVAGATALDRTNSVMETNASLSVQLGWFKELKPHLCSSQQECKEFFKKSLFLVGEIGGNDYNYPLLGGKPMKDVEALVPTVIEAITSAITALIEEGVTHLMVPGNFPIGCVPIYLTLFESQNATDYDKFGCLKAFNAFSKFHNLMLKRSLETLRQRYPHTKIVYADYYGATMQYIRAPKRYGLSRRTLLKACCGGGGRYNYNTSTTCGSETSSVCEDPSTYQNWDGVHFTEAAYRVISNGLLNRGFTAPPLIPYSSPLIRGRAIPAETKLI